MRHGLAVFQPGGRNGGADPGGTACWTPAGRTLPTPSTPWAANWTFYPETLASTQADLRGRETGAHDESVPYGTYRLELLAQPGQYLVLSGYSFDYSTRVYLNGKQVLEIGKVADTAAASEARINYMDIPIYTGEDGRVEIVCQYANFVHKEGGSLPRLYLSSPEKTQEMQRGNDLYSLALSGGLCLFGCYFLLLAAIQRGRNMAFWP